MPCDTGDSRQTVDGEDMTFMFPGVIMIFPDDGPVPDAGGTRASTTCTVDLTKGTLSMVGTSTNVNVNEGDPTFSLTAGSRDRKVRCPERGVCPGDRAQPGPPVVS